jgi:hypothetical protein
MGRRDRDAVRLDAVCEDCRTRGSAPPEVERDFQCGLAIGSHFKPIGRLRSLLLELLL